jgi:hypothetical protein
MIDPSEQLLQQIQKESNQLSSRADEQVSREVRVANARLKADNKKFLENAKRRTAEETSSYCDDMDCLLFSNDGEGFLEIEGADGEDAILAMDDEEETEADLALEQKNLGNHMMKRAKELKNPNYYRSALIHYNNAAEHAAVAWNEVPASANPEVLRQAVLAHEDLGKLYSVILSNRAAVQIELKNYGSLIIIYSPGLVCFIMA